MSEQTQDQKERAEFVRAEKQESKRTYTPVRERMANLAGTGIDVCLRFLIQFSHGKC